MKFKFFALIIFPLIFVSKSWALVESGPQSAKECITNQWFIKINLNDQSSKEDLLKVFEVLGQFNKYGMKIDNVSPLRAVDGPARQLFVRYTPTKLYDPKTKTQVQADPSEVRASFTEAISSIRGTKLECFGFGAVSGGN